MAAVCGHCRCSCSCSYYFPYHGNCRCSTDCCSFAPFLLMPACCCPFAENQWIIALPERTGNQLPAESRNVLLSLPPCVFPRVSTTQNRYTVQSDTAPDWFLLVRSKAAVQVRHWAHRFQKTFACHAFCSSSNWAGCWRSIGFVVQLLPVKRRRTMEGTRRSRHFHLRKSTSVQTAKWLLQNLLCWRTSMLPPPKQTPTSHCTKLEHPPPPPADSQTLNVFSLQQPLRIPYCSSSNYIELSLSLRVSVHRITGSRRRSSQISLQESRGFFSQSRCSKTIKTASTSLLFLLLLVLHISSGKLEIQKHKQNGKQKT